jgi:hypothetical protein
MNTFKAYAARHLRESNLLAAEAKLWSRHGSTRYLWTDKHIETAVDYVINRQGDELPSFECVCLKALPHGRATDTQIVLTASIRFSATTSGFCSNVLRWFFP